MNKTYIYFVFFRHMPIFVFLGFCEKSDDDLGHFDEERERNAQNFLTQLCMQAKLYHRRPNRSRLHLHRDTAHTNSFSTGFRAQFAT